MPVTPTKPIWTIGWFGKLRCRKSLDLLTALARKMSDNIFVYLRGFPDPIPSEEFHAAISGLPNILYEGRYKIPDDLPGMMSKIHFNWCGDLSDSDGNARWLLPNRIYEGGYFGIPAVTFEGSEIADYVRGHELGYVLPSPDLDTLTAFLESITAEQFEKMCVSLKLKPVEWFMDCGEFPHALEEILSEVPHHARRTTS